MSIQVDRPEPAITRILISRPDKRNAIDAGVRLDLLAALDEVRASMDCRAVVLGGAGGTFSAGGDLPSMVGLSEAQARERMAQGGRVCRALAEMPLPVVIAAQGWCAGAAGGLSMLGDHVVAGADTRFLFPFLSLGLVPDWGLLRSLPARVGVGAARRILTAGRPIAGEEAFTIGLVDEFVGQGDVMAAAVARAAMLAQYSLPAFARLKARLREWTTFEADLDREADDQTALLLGGDFPEGYAAFAEGRKPRFAALAADRNEAV